MKNEDCIKCKHCEPFCDQNGLSYLGCCYVSNKRRWIAQIETCPMAEKEKAITEAETYLSDLAASLEKEHAHIVDEKGVEYSAGMIRSIVEVLKAVRTARRVPDGC